MVLKAICCYFPTHFSFFRSDAIYDALFNLGADVALLVPEPFFKHTSNKSVHEEFKTKKM